MSSAFGRNTVLLVATYRVIRVSYGATRPGCTPGYPGTDTQLPVVTETDSETLDRRELPHKLIGMAHHKFQVSKWLGTTSRYSLPAHVLLRVRGRRSMLQQYPVPRGSGASLRVCHHVWNTDSLALQAQCCNTDLTLPLAAPGTQRLASNFASGSRMISEAQSDSATRVPGYPGMSE
eukprot:2133845-Rhodomonas_salina.1